MTDMLTWNRGVLFLVIHYFLLIIGLFSRAEGFIATSWLVLFVASAIFSASCFIHQLFSPKNKRSSGVLMVLTLAASPAILLMVAWLVSSLRFMIKGEKATDAPDQRYAFHVATREAKRPLNLPEVKKLLAGCPEILEVIHHSQGGSTPLFLCEINVIEHVIRADQERVKKQGGTSILASQVLMKAIHDCEVKMVNLSLTLGADPNFRETWGTMGSFDTPWLMAAKISNQNIKEYREIVKALVKAKVRVNVKDHRDNSFWHLMPEMLDAQILEEWLATGMDPNLADKNGNTLLHIIARQNLLKVASEKGERGPVLEALKTRLRESMAKRSAVLKKYRADLLKKNDAGNAPLHIAAENHNALFIENFVVSPAQLTAFNSSGDTPFIKAALANDPDCLQALLAKGADVNLPRRSGESALWIVERGCPSAEYRSAKEIGNLRQNWNETIRLLKAHGARSFKRQ